MNPTRLFVLGVLAENGPMHGHKIMQEVQLDQVELWTDIKPGSLYGALRRMAAEGAVEPIRTEQEGNLPARTVYAITDAGHRELDRQIAETLREVRLRPDPVDLALQRADTLDEHELTEIVTERRRVFAERLEMMRALKKRSGQYLRGLEPVAFDHTLMRLETEVAWHDLLLADLPSYYQQRNQQRKGAS